MTAGNALEKHGWHVAEPLALVVLNLIEKITRRKLDDGRKTSFVQFVKFCIVGLSNTVISYILYLVSLLLFRGLGILKGYDYLVAQVIQFVLSVLWSY